MSTRIAIVDDEPLIQELLSDYLQEEGFETYAGADGRWLDELVACRMVDLVLLDLNLAGEDGLEIVKRIAQLETIPVLIMTGERIDDADKAIGLELGADDYIEKPFSLRELVARIRVSLRPPPLNIKRALEPVFKFDGWSLNIRLRKLTNPDGNNVQLTPSEFTVLTSFVKAPQTILTREMLLSSRSEGAHALDERSVDVVVNRLRRKLAGSRDSAPLIDTERGVGYTFTRPVQQLKIRRPCPPILTTIC
ncbi:response regulator [Rhizobium leguminosarum]|uniref:response regulator n=1 Tax=Rhizobium leguminosarum TaxID=384 RepID=UPI001C974A18|nr:response regulator [Rhizobium leguminosarum]MBY5538277.1 response regulator [Rhizobium leguminosarum]